MPKQDETYPKTRHQYALVAPKNHASVRCVKPSKPNQGDHKMSIGNTTHAMSFQDDKEMAKQRLQASGELCICWPFAIPVAVQRELEAIK